VRDETRKEARLEGSYRFATPFVTVALYPALQARSLAEDIPHPGRNLTPRLPSLCNQDQISRTRALGTLGIDAGEVGRTAPRRPR
jgi:hypothetical protein